MASKKNFDNAEALKNMDMIIQDMKNNKPKPKAEKKDPEKAENGGKGGRPKKTVKKSDLYKRTTMYIDKDIKAFFEDLYARDMTGDSFSALVNRLLEKEKKRIEKKKEV